MTSIFCNVPELRSKLVTESSSEQSAEQGSGPLIPGKVLKNGQTPHQSLAAGPGTVVASDPFPV